LVQRLFRTLIIFFFVVFGAGFGLTACSGGQGETPATGPPAKFASRIESSKLIYVTPVEGANGSARLVLADAIAAALRDARKPAIISKKMNEMGPTIAGRIVAAETRGSVVWVTAVWDLRAPYGTSVAEYRQQVVVDANLWQAGSAEAINLLVSDAGPQVAAMVEDYVSPVAMVEDRPVAMPGESSGVGGVPDTAFEEIMAAPKPSPVYSPRAPQVTKARPGKKKTVMKPPQKPIRKPATETARKPAATSEVAALPPLPPRSQKLTQKPALKPLRAASRPLPLSRPQALSKKRLEPVLKPLKRAKSKKKPVLRPVPEEGPSRIVAPPPPVAWDNPAFLIKPVQGAPGDGNEALVKAMKSALRKRDISVTEDPRQAGYVIEGKVRLSPVVNGRQQAKITWVVNTIAGDEVGKAVQENAIKAGSLNGSWGRIADIVSLAAVAGIRELFGLEDKRSSRFGDEPKFSGGPDLPHLPGRGPPPPN